MATCTATSSSFSVMPDADDVRITTLLDSFLHNPALLATFHVPRFKLRLATIQAWGVREGDHLLDIGCGQGESSVALAAAVGSRGHVTGIDTAAMDYGHPFTMSEAHAHVQASVLGPRVSFHQADAQSFLAAAGQQTTNNNGIDGAVLCQSLFYFPSEDEVHALFATLRGAGISPIYVAEWSYAPSHPAQMAHVLAARAQKLFYWYRPECRTDVREQNVRAGVDQDAILRAARAVGYRVAKEALITPDDDMLEGQFEVRFTLGAVFQQRVAEAALLEEQRAEIAAAVREVEVELDKDVYKGGTVVKSMDVWVAVFELDK